jgi:hypothetical protein
MVDSDQNGGAVMTPLDVFRWSNLLLAFVLEVGALVALSYTGAQLGDGGVGATLLAIGLPLVAAVLWGMFAAPRSVKHVRAAKVTVKIAVFGMATIGLFFGGHAGLAVAFAGLFVINTVALQLTGGPPGARMSSEDLPGDSGGRVVTVSGTVGV